MNWKKTGRYFGPLILFFFLFLFFNSLNADEPRIIRVRPGDTLSYLSFKIYGMYDLRMGERLRQENPQVKDIDRIYAGQELRFPGPEVMKQWMGELRAKTPAPEPAPRDVRPREAPLADTKVRASKGVITFLEGQVQAKKAGEGQWSLAQANMVLSEDDQVKVLGKSRAELILDNQTVIRLFENTVLTIQKLEQEPATQTDTARMGLSLGKIWTRTAKFFNRSSRFDVKTPTAIAGVQGTIYQMDVANDGTTSIQVFQGVVNVYNPFPTARPSSPGQGPQTGKPQEVAGPEEVKGPSPVSREEWTKIVLSQFQQMTVTGRGFPRATSFEVQKERQNEWVRWNEERDKDFQPPSKDR